MRRRAADIADFEIRTAAAHPIHPTRPHEPIRIPAFSGHDSESRVIRIRSQGATNAIYKERRELIAVAMEAPGTQESYIPCAVGPSLIPTQARDAPSRYALQAHVIVGNLYLPIRKQTKGIRRTSLSRPRSKSKSSLHRFIVRILRLSVRCRRRYRL